MIPFQGSKFPQEVDLSEPVRPWEMFFVIGDAEFQNEHCTIQTPTIIESRTPEVCVATTEGWQTQLNDGRQVEDTSINIRRAGEECIIEASTSEGVTQTIIFVSND